MNPEWNFPFSFQLFAETSLPPLSIFSETQAVLTEHKKALFFFIFFFLSGGKQAKLSRQGRAACVH